jgi:ABC-2 type transport system permease protein
MRTDVARLDLHNRRHLTSAYTIGMALYMLVIVVLYPSFRHSSELNSLSSGKLAALFGVSGPLTSPAGWVNANAYTNFLPLIMLLLTIGYGAAAIAGQDDDETLGLLVVLPLARHGILTQKITEMIAQALVLIVVVAACVYVGRGFELALDPWNVATASLAVLWLGIDLGLIALTVGAVTGSRGSAIGVATAIAAVSYLISTLAPIVSWVRPLRFASLFYWSVGNNQLADGAGLASFAVLAGVAALTGFTANVAFRRLDVR